VLEVVYALRGNKLLEGLLRNYVTYLYAPSNYPGKWNHTPPNIRGEGEVGKPSGKKSNFHGHAQST
jgi:hypothetical protein